MRLKPLVLRVMGLATAIAFLIELRNEGHLVVSRLTKGGQVRVYTRFVQEMRLKPLNRSLAASVSTDQALRDDLVRWMLQNGARLQQLNATRVLDVRYGRELIGGVVATAPIPRGALFASVPARLLLGRESAMATELSAPIARERLSSFVALVLMLLTEGARATREPNSGWAPYMRLLATITTDSPSTWSAERLADATPTMRELAQLHARTVRATHEALSARAPDAMLLTGNATLAQFQRAWDLAMSRFWLLEGRSIMVPLADMLNFGDDPTTCDLVHPDGRTLDGRTLTSITAQSQLRFEMTLQQAYLPGEELRFFYNEHCAEEYLLYYLFALEGARPCRAKEGLQNYWFQGMLSDDGSVSLTD